MMEEFKRTEDELDKMIQALSWEVVQADVFFKLNSDLRAAIPDYFVEMNNSNTFWQLTLDGLLDSALIRLCRVYDPDRKTISLPNLLLAIRNNLDLFESSRFRARMDGRDIEEWVLSKNNVPSLEIIDEDFASVSKTNPKVRDLLEWRGNVYAHRNLERAIRPEDFNDRPTLSNSDLKQLIASGLEIVNRYSVLFKLHSYSSQIVGHDDFRFLLKSVKRVKEAMHD